MNIGVGNYQIFSGAPFWIGFSKFKRSMGLILEWQMGLGFLRINKFIDKKSREVL